VHFLYAGKYDGLAPYLFMLTLVPLVMWIGSTMGHALNAAEKPRFVFWAYVSSGAATFLLGIPLVIHFGLWGAVYGMLLSGTTYTIALAISFFFTFWDAGLKRIGQAGGAVEYQTYR
jgi:O-antigen/teichoic acid export membrane protein